jgi:trpB: tryptophan synthase, beta subunit
LTTRALDRSMHICMTSAAPNTFR